jgi:hypothetical protein
MHRILRRNREHLFFVLQNLSPTHESLPSAMLPDAESLQVRLFVRSLVYLPNS